MIDIRLTFLDSGISTLKTMVNNSKSVQQDILITSSKGVYFDEFNIVAGELVAIKNSLDILLTNTISVLEDAKDLYAGSDKLSADLFEAVKK